MAEKAKLYRDDVSGIYTDENGNPVNADQSFGSRPDTWQNAAVNGGLLSYLWGKGKEAVNNPDAPWNQQNGLLAVVDTAALPAKVVGEGLLALPDRIQNVTGAAQRGDYGPATDDAMSVAFSGLPIGTAAAPGGVVGMMAGKMPKAAKAAEAAIPMDEASRMARARQMGMNVSGFHGTGANIEEFNTPVVWMSEQPGFANRYAYARGGGDGDNVLPIMGRSDRPFVFDNAGREQTPNTILSVAMDQARKMHPDSSTFSKSLDKDKVISLMRDIQKEYRDVGSKSAFEYWDNPKFVDYLKALGFDSISVKEGGVPTVGIIGKNNVRSRFAAFDPAKRDSADLLASVGGPAGLLGIAASNRDEEKRK